jgi:hypothetical protein
MEVRAEAGASDGGDVLDEEDGLPGEVDTIIRLRDKKDRER